jgi:hypothetical protein
MTLLQQLFGGIYYTSYYHLICEHSLTTSFFYYGQILQLCLHSLSFLHNKKGFDYFLSKTKTLL